MTPAPPPQLVVAAAIVDDVVGPTALLAARRCTPASLAGRWEFPGGKVEVGEEPIAALHREILEELGVQIALGPELAGPAGGVWVLTDRYVMRLWLATIVAGTPSPLVEHDELRWLAAGHWSDVPWLDADLPLVHTLTLVSTGKRGL